MGFAIAFAAGVLLWTLVEYVMHRFVFHRHVFGKWVALEHTTHHAKVNSFSHWWLKAALVPPGLLVIAAPAMRILGAYGVALGVGSVSAWLVYEVIHRRIHVAAPRGAYAHWARAHHLSHHFGKVHSNHGISSPLWDHVFGTFEAPGVVTVPRVFAHQFPWLVEDREGKLAVRSAYESAYRIA